MDNCEYGLRYKMYAPNNTYIGVCSKTKFNWYLRKKLATLISDDAIKLLFEPQAGKKQHREIFLRKQNKCTICGIDNEELFSYHIVPHKFKKWFPLIKKSRVSNDIVPLCDNCRSETCKLHDFYTKELYQEHKFEAFTNIKSNIHLIEKYKKGFIEPNSRAFQKICDLIGKSDFTIDDLDNYIKNANSILPEKQIVKKYIDDDKLKEFVDNWKTLFVENMNPKYLAGDFFNYDDGWV